MTEARHRFELRRGTRPWAIFAFAGLAGGAVLSVWFLCAFYGWVTLPNWTWLATVGAVTLLSLLYGVRTARGIIARLDHPTPEGDGVLILVPEFGPELPLPLRSQEFERFMRTRTLSPDLIAARTAPQRSALEDVCLWLFQDTPHASRFRACLEDQASRSARERPLPG